MPDFFEDEEPEVIYLDDLPTDTDIYGNVIGRSDWSGVDEDFDGESLIDRLLSGDTE